MMTESEKGDKGSGNVIILQWWVERRQMAQMREREGGRKRESKGDNMRTRYEL
jgi:hypothetical protein